MKNGNMSVNEAMQVLANALERVLKTNINNGHSKQRHRRWFKMPKKLVGNIRGLHKDGLTQRAIAKRLGVSQSTVSTHLRKP